MVHEACSLRSTILAMSPSILYLAIRLELLRFSRELLVELLMRSLSPVSFGPCFPSRLKVRESANGGFPSQPASERNRGYAPLQNLLQTVNAHSTAQANVRILSSSPRLPFGHLSSVRIWQRGQANFSIEAMPIGFGSLVSTLR